MRGNSLRRLCGRLLLWVHIFEKVRIIVHTLFFRKKGHAICVECVSFVFGPKGLQVKNVCVVWI